MGALSITMFVGITALALTLHVHVAASPTDLGLPADAATQTVLAQIAQTVFGNGVFFYFVQAGTAAILILAANTAYNGFPLLASLLAFGPAPAGTNCTIAATAWSTATGSSCWPGSPWTLIGAFNAEVSSIIQLYIIGVFLSFTLSQAGMVRHWQRELSARQPGASRNRMKRAQVINAAGALATGAVLVIVVDHEVHSRGLDRHYRHAPALPDQ